MTARLIATTLGWLLDAWLAAGVVRQFRRDIALPDRLTQAAKNIFFELKPFALPLIVAAHLADVWANGHPYNAGRMIVTAVCLGAWWVHRNDKDDDDRWRRRRRRAAQAVREIGGRLVVVPQGAAS